MQAALAGERDSDVACGSCVGCCTSSQFVHIEPDETDALSHIPKALTFPAPRLPGHVLLGYDQHGRCPMLIEGRCSIYAHRPRTCRVYDCRVFPASGLDAAADDKPRIAERARRWVFTYSTASGEVLHAAVRSAAMFLEAHRAELPEGTVPASATHLAALAVRAHAVFIDRQPTVAEVSVELSRRRNPPGL
jgi:uncharacterized protein